MLTPSAILLLGPTGSGKTPLGQYWEQAGLWSRRCAHFDFGHHLRAAAQTNPPPDLSINPLPPRAMVVPTVSAPSPDQHGQDDRGTRQPDSTNHFLAPDELAVIRHSLATGALLEDRHFPIAAKILRAFAAARQLAPADLIILNGLPRHAGQARDVDSILNILAVVTLDCSAQTVLDRIHLNTGGDRAGRIDDDLPAIQRKVAIFSERTQPLIEYYQTRGVTVCHVAVAVNTSARDIDLAVRPRKPAAISDP